MANCKSCGKTVRSAPIAHERCTTRLIKEVSNDICDNYCRHARSEMNEDEVENICGNCPLNRLYQLCG